MAGRSESLATMFLKLIAMPVRFKRFFRDFRHMEFNLLDVGCGYGSPSVTLDYFPRCRYYGLDRTTSSNDNHNLKLMRGFFEIDLDFDPLDAVPDNIFDVILFSHVIEHLRHGTSVLGSLTRKLRPGGLLYVEYPGVRSLAAPHSRDPLECSHFCDDPTHVRIYTTAEVTNTLLSNHMHIIKAGVRRDPVRLLLSPAMLAIGAIRGSSWDRSCWDLFGFAEYVFARRLEHRDGSAKGR